MLLLVVNDCHQGGFRDSQACRGGRKVINITDIMFYMVQISMIYRGTDYDVLYVCITVVCMFYVAVACPAQSSVPCAEKFGRFD